MAYRHYQGGRRERLGESCERTYLYNTVPTEIRPQNNNAGTLHMRGFFFRKGSTLTTFSFLVDEGREDPNITKSQPSSARQ